MTEGERESKRAVHAGGTRGNKLAILYFCAPKFISTSCAVFFMRLVTLH